MFNNNHAVQLLIDPESGQIVDANPAAVAFYGHTHDQLCAMHIQQINTLTDVEVRAEMQRAHDQEHNYFEFQHRLASGEVRYVDVYSGPIQAGNRKLLYSIIIDATERKQMEIALRDSEQRYRTMADFNTDWTYWEKADGSLHYVSPACETISGYTAKELRTDPSLFARMVLPADRQLWEAHTHPLTPQDTIRTLQLRIRHKNGTVRWIEHTCRPLYDERGQFAGYRASNRDITEQKQRQQREFELALERERIGLLTEFIQNAAHEFRTPLATISAQAYMLGRSNDPARLATIAERITTQVERMTGLVDSLLVMNKLESEGLFDWQPVKPGEILAPVCDALRANYGDAPVLAREGCSDCPPVLGEPRLLADALRHVLDNAYRFTPPEGSITVTTGTCATLVWIEISDTGRGIAAEDLPHIFDTFWRDDKAHTTPGFGLGLSIARKIIALHGGDITASSVAGVGSTLRITLPLLQVD